MSETRKKLKERSLVTGGANGIGKATACLFANGGAHVVVIADIQDALGEEVVRSIGPDWCMFMHVDVAGEEHVRLMVESTVRDFGRIDIMFSNAGIASRSEQNAIDMDFAEFDHLFAVNMRGVALCVKPAARAMVEGGVRGSIVCSISGSNGGCRRTDYHMAKHAVVGLVKSTSEHLGGNRIRVNCVSPYAVAMPLICNALGVSLEKIEKIYEPHTALKGIVLGVENVADGAVSRVRLLAVHHRSRLGG